MKEIFSLLGFIMKRISKKTSHTLLLSLCLRDSVADIFPFSKRQSSDIKRTRKTNPRD